MYCPPCNGNPEMKSLNMPTSTSIQLNTTHINIPANVHTAAQMRLSLRVRSGRRRITLCEKPSSASSTLFSSKTSSQEVRPYLPSYPFSFNIAASFAFPRDRCDLTVPAGIPVISATRSMVCPSTSCNTTQRRSSSLSSLRQL